MQHPFLPELQRLLPHPLDAFLNFLNRGLLVIPLAPNAELLGAEVVLQHLKRSLLLLAELKLRADRAPV